MVDVRIKGHRIYVNGEKVEYRRTRNGGGKIKPVGQIMHHTSSGPNSINGVVSWLTNPRARASAHTVINGDGRIVQLMPLNERTWHAGRSRWRGVSDLNKNTIGHEICNPGQLRRQADGRFSGVNGPYNAEHVVEATSPAHGNLRYWLEFTPEQLDMTFALTKAIHDYYELDYVATHWEVSPGRKVDPGPHFPLERLRGHLAGRGDYESPRSHEIDPIVDRAVDGYVVVNSSLNMRRWPGPASEVVAQLPNDTPFAIVRSGVFGDDDTRWHLIQARGEEGWVHSAFTRLV